jgi:hypothetical protein
VIDGELLLDAAQVKIDVLSANRLKAEPCRLTPTKIKTCFLKCGFLTDHVSSNDDSAVKFTEDEEDDWHRLQPLGAQYED